MPRVLGPLPSAHARCPTHTPVSHFSQLVRSQSRHAFSSQRCAATGASDTEPAAAAAAAAAAAPEEVELSDEELAAFADEMTAVTDDNPMTEEEMGDWDKYFQAENLLDMEVSEEPVAPEEPKPLVVRGQCYGCGVPLQASSSEDAGYVPADKYLEKSRHRKQQKAFLCSRCVSLTHGAMVPGVADFSVVLDEAASAARRGAQQTAAVPVEEALVSHGRTLLTPQQLRDQLKVVRTTKSMCVMIIDVLDASGSFLSRVRDLVGSNPVVLVANKCDLLPKGTNLEEVKRWLAELVAFKKLNVISVHLISSKQGDGMDECMASILTQRVGRDVYVLGAANVGKTAFVRAMLLKMQVANSRHFDAAASAAKYLPVVSAMPGTTLGLVQLGVYSSGGYLYDTPGLHLHHRMPHILMPDELKAMHPTRRLRPYIPPTPAALAEEHGSVDAVTGDSLPSGTYHWGSLLRIDVLEAPADASLLFYGTGAIQAHALPLLEMDERLEYDPTEDVQPEDVLFGAGSVSRRGGLQVVREATVRATRSFEGSGAIPLADVAVGGMPGWVTVVSGGTKGVVRLRLWAPKGVEVYVRPPLPCALPTIKSSDVGAASPAAESSEASVAL